MMGLDSLSARVGLLSEGRTGGEGAGPGEVGTGQNAESWHSARVEDPAADLVGAGGEGVGQGGGDVPGTATRLTGTPEGRPWAGGRVVTLQPPASEGGPSPNPWTVRPGVKRLGDAMVRAQRKGLGAWLARAKMDRSARVGLSDECEPGANGDQGARMGKGSEAERGGVGREGEGGGVTVVNKGKFLRGSAAESSECDPGDRCPGGVGTTRCPDDRSQGMSGDRGSSM